MTSTASKYDEAVAAIEHLHGISDGLGASPAGDLIHPDEDSASVDWLHATLVEIEFNHSGSILAGKVAMTPAGVWATTVQGQSRRATATGEGPSARVSFFPMHRISRITIVRER